MREIRQWCSIKSLKRNVACWSCTSVFAVFSNNFCSPWCTEGLQREGGSFLSSTPPLLLEVTDESNLACALKSCLKTLWQSIPDWTYLNVPPGNVFNIYQTFHLYKGVWKWDYWDCDGYVLKTASKTYWIRLDRVCVFVFHLKCSIFTSQNVCVR